MQIQRQLISIPFITLALAGLVQADWDVSEDPADVFERQMLVEGFTEEQIAANIKAKGYDWQDEKGHWVVTPAPEKYVPEVPEWVERDYRDLTDASDSKVRICWDDRPIKKKCYEGRVTFYDCNRMRLDSYELAKHKKYYDNKCRNWDWDAYWVEYKAEKEVGRR